MIDVNAHASMRWDFISAEAEPAAVIFYLWLRDRKGHPWVLQELLDSLPNAFPEEVLSHVDVGDDQTVLMAVNKFRVYMKFFKKDLLKNARLPFKERNSLL